MRQARHAPQKTTGSTTTRSRRRSRCPSAPPRPRRTSRGRSRHRAAPDGRVTLEDVQVGTQMPRAARAATPRRGRSRRRHGAGREPPRPLVEDARIVAGIMPRGNTRGSWHRLRIPTHSKNQARGGGMVDLDRIRHDQGEAGEWPAAAREVLDHVVRPRIGSALRRVRAVIVHRRSNASAASAPGTPPFSPDVLCRLGRRAAAIGV